VAALDRGEMCAVLRDFEAGIISLGGDEAAVARVLGTDFFISRVSCQAKVTNFFSLPVDIRKKKVCQ
jgi:hypothetical protein